TLLGERRDSPHARVGQREKVLPDPLDSERVLPDQEGRDPLENLADGSHALGTGLGQERTMRLADPHEPGVGGEPHDQLAYTADRRGGRADRLGQRGGQHIRLERGGLHSVRVRGDDTPDEGEIGGGSRGRLAGASPPRYSRRATTKEDSSYHTHSYAPVFSFSPLPRRRLSSAHSQLRLL